MQAGRLGVRVRMPHGSEMELEKGKSFTQVFLPSVVQGPPVWESSMELAKAADF